MTNPNDLAVTPHPDFKRNTILIEKFGMPLSKREHFAALAMQGLLAASGNDSISTKSIFEILGLPSDTKYEYPKHYMEYTALASVAAADALITSLNKTNK